MLVRHRCERQRIQTRLYCLQELRRRFRISGQSCRRGTLLLLCERRHPGRLGRQIVRPREEETIIRGGRCRCLARRWTGHRWWWQGTISSRYRCRWGRRELSGKFDESIRSMILLLIDGLSVTCGYSHPTSIRRFWVTIFLLGLCTIDVILGNISFILNEISGHTGMFVFDVIRSGIASKNLFTTIPTPRIKWWCFFCLFISSRKIPMKVTESHILLLSVVSACVHSWFSLTDQSVLCCCTHLEMNR